MQHKRESSSQALAALVAGFLIVFLLAAPGASEAQEAKADSPSDAAKADAPEFKKEAAAKEFEKGKKLYAEGKLKEAGSAFKKALRGAKAKKDNDIVKNWSKAVKGKQLLERLRKTAAKNPHGAHMQVTSYAGVYADTAVGPEFKAFLKELDDLVMYVFEGFDRRSGLYTEKYGKTFIKDPKLVHDGPMCLRWVSLRDRKGAMLKVTSVPRNWEEFSAIELWYNTPVPPAGAEAVVVCRGKTEGVTDPRAGRKGGVKQLQNSYHTRINFRKTGGRWTSIRLPLNKFRQSGEASLKQVVDFRIQIAAGRNFDVLLDRFSLIRHPQSARRSKAEKKTGKKGPKGR